jgi:hypothetical protein
MSTHSTDGREWAKLSELKAGDKIQTDGGFTCGMNNKILIVENDDDDKLFVRCGEGNHLLAGQVDSDEGHLVGMWRV